MVSMRLVYFGIGASLGFLVGACSQAPVQSVTTAKTPTSESRTDLNVGRLLVQARDAAVEGNFAEAHRLMANANAVPNKSQLEQYKIAEIRAYIAGREKDLMTVESAYEEMVNSPVAEPETYLDYLKKLTLVSFGNRHYDKTVLYGNQWLVKNPRFDAPVGEAVANAYYLNRDYANAEHVIDRLLASYDNRKGEVKLAWLQIKLSCVAVLRGKQSDPALRKQFAETYPQFRKQLLSPP